MSLSTITAPRIEVAAAAAAAAKSRVMGLPATKRPNSEPLSLTRPSVSDTILQQNRPNTSNEVTHI
ncbi:hypothetical protein PP707_06905, partial [Acetobacter pasteurianus]|nr:hypothetical protein [Acetobacter pasteurianus]